MNGAIAEFSSQLNQLWVLVKNISSDEKMLLHFSEQGIEFDYFLRMEQLISDFYADNNNATQMRYQRRFKTSNFNLERSILGSLLLNNEGINTAKKMDLGPQYFSDPSYRQIYAAILGIYGNQCLTVDLLTLTNYLIQNEQFDKIGGADTLCNLFGYAHTIQNVGPDIATLMSKKK